MSDRIPADAALRLQLAALAGNEPPSSFFELRPLTPAGQAATRERAFLPVRQLGDVARRIRELASAYNVFVGAAPRVREEGTAAAVERVWCLWADLDGPEALARLVKFRPLPSIVVRTGSPDHAHAYWPLRRAVSPQGAQRGNRRLALALGGDMGATDAARILRPAGTLNHKHRPPTVVECTRLELNVFDLADVVGDLPDSDHYVQRPRPNAKHKTADPSRALAGLTRTVADAQKGNRNNALYWAGRRVREHGDELDVGEALAELREAAAHAGLPEQRVEPTLASALGVRAAA